MGRPTSPLPPRQRLFILAALCVVIAYGLMNTSYPWTLITGQMAWSNVMLSALVSPDFVSGSPHTPQWLANYSRAFGQIAVHAGIGGLALSLCALQFVPGLRQRSPRAHRLIGWVAVGATLLSMVGAIAYLSATPLHQVFGGPTFGIGLWLLAISTLMSIAMGVLTARRRNWREHMGWMTMTGALLLTAPLLRIGDVLVGRMFPVHVDDAANLLVGGLNALAMWACLWWAQRAGQRELPLLPAQSVYPPAAWMVVAALGVALIVHETLLAPMGLDLMAALGHPRNASEMLPRAATTWGLITLLVMPETARVLRDDAWHQGDLRMPRSLAALTLAQGLAALFAASPWGAGGWQTYNHATLTGVWAVSGAISVVWSLAALAGRLDGRQAHRARLMGLIHHLAPGAWALMLPLLPWWGLDAGAVLAVAAMLGQGTVTWYGGASALGLALPGMPRKAGTPATTGPMATTASGSTTNALA
jgi:Predicted membrane protein (DUF2306)